FSVGLSAARVVAGKASNSAKAGRMSRTRSRITGILNTGSGGKVRSLRTTRLISDRGGDREDLDGRARERALAGHAHALDDRQRAARAPGEPAGARGVRERQLDGGAVLEDLDVAGAFELAHELVRERDAGGLGLAGGGEVQDLAGVALGLGLGDLEDLRA